MTLEELLADPLIPLSEKYPNPFGNQQPIQNKSAFSNPFQGKSVTDFIPNVFGRTAPANYQGLLSAGILTPEQVAQTQKTANIQGLLGAGLALAQGMSRTGARRSGAQNILSALGAGLGASGGAYQQGLQDFSTQQQLQSAVMQQRKALQSQQAIEKVIQSPEVANNPTLVAYFRANPDKALEHYMKRQMVQEARLDPNQPPQIAAQPSAQPPAQVSPSNVELGIVPPPGEEATKFLPEVPTITKASQYEKQAAEADRAAQYYANIGENKTAEDLRKEADYFRGLFNKEGLVTNIESSLADVDPTLRPRANALINNAPGLTQEQIQSEARAILTDHANLMQLLDPRVVALGLAKAKEGAARIYTGELSKPTAGQVEQGALSNADAITRLNNIQYSYKPEYQNIQFRSKQAWNTLRDKFGNLPNNEKQQLTQYSQYRQNSLQNLNQTIKDITGAAMGVQEADRIMASLPNAGTDIFSGDSPTEFEAKLNNAVKQTKYALARKNYALKNGLQWENTSLESMPNIIQNRGKEIEKQYSLDPKDPATKQTVLRQLAAEFGVAF